MKVSTLSEFRQKQIKVEYVVETKLEFHITMIVIITYKPTIEWHKSGKQNLDWPPTR